MGGTICICRSKDQVGKSLLWLPYFITNKMIDSIISAEEKLGKPPGSIEIFVEMKQRHNIPNVNNIFEGAAVITSLYREDMIFANDVASNFSVTRHEGFLTYSERFRKLFGDGYATARDGSVVVKTARTINLKKLNNMLRSKDENLFSE